MPKLLALFDFNGLIYSSGAQMGRRPNRDIYVSIYIYLYSYIFIYTFMHIMKTAPKVGVDAKLESNSLYTYI